MSMAGSWIRPGWVTSGWIVLSCIILGLLSLWQVVSAQEQSHNQPVELDTMEVHSSSNFVPRQGKAETRLSGDALRVKTAATLGQTLSGELGVNNASFGSGVGLPVLRGLTGSRVRLMQDGIASHDASSVSPDHATSLDASLAEEIQIIRGPAVLEYGGGAIGGVVNVIDNRIPATLPAETLTGSAEARYDSNADKRGTSFRIDTGINKLAVHANGFYRRNNNTAINGPALDIPALTEQFGPDNYVTTVDVLDNTNAEAHGGSLGASLIGRDGFAGFAVNTYNNDYGIPPGVHVDLGVVQKVRIEARQTRYDFKAQLHDLGDAIPELRFRTAYVDYEHDEFESGNTGTRFSNQAWEAQIAADHVTSPLSSNTPMKGTAGIQLLDRDFSALGVEAFVPLSRQQMLGAYLIETLEFTKWRFEVGARAEIQRIDQLQTIDCVGLNTSFQRERSEFNSYSYSSATHWRFKPNATLRFSLSHAQRAPDIQELLACGEHLATQTYDLAFSFNGMDSSGLEQETFNTLDLGLHWDGAWLSLKLNLFYNQIDDFIYQRNLSTASNGPFYNPEKKVFQGTCASGSQCFPLMQYTQQDANMAGYELQLDWPLHEATHNNWTMILFSDYVRAQLEDGEDVPRMPPLRLGSALAYSHGTSLDAELRLTHGFEQDHPGENETASDSYNLLNASLNYRPRLGSIKATIFFNAQNLLDEEIRNATSFLRNYAPEPGRGFELGMRAEF